MKILLATGIYPPDAGGPATYTRALARAIASSGEHQAEVVAYGDMDGVDEKDGYRVERVGRNHDVLTRYWNFFLATYQRAKTSDVVYLQGPVSEGFPGTLAAMLAGKPTVMKIVGDYAWEIYMQSDEILARSRGGARGARSEQGVELLDEFLTRGHDGKIGWIERIERWTAKRAKKIIVPSAYLKTVVTTWGVPSESIQVIYNGVEPLDQGRDREQARSAFGITDKRVLLTVIRAVPWKGGDFIISLLPDLPPDIIFAIAGDGPSLEAWKEEATRLQVSDRVRFLGKLDRVELAEWYRAADLFVLASGYEGFSHVAIEAGIVGLPMYLSDRDGNKEMETMFPTQVKVLSYKDRGVWIEALTGSLWNRVAESDAGKMRMRMIEDAVLVLKEVAKDL